MAAVPDIRPLGLVDTAPAAALLARAFLDNPAYLAVLGYLSPRARLAALTRVKRGFARAVLPASASELAWLDGEPAGVLLALPPGSLPLSPLGWIRRASGCATTGPRGIFRFLKLDAHLGRWHIREPHFYVFVVGVEPALQGRGVGSALLRRVSERADAAQLPCYLETDKELNVRLYERLGYRVVTDERLANLGGLRMWTMRRPARS